MVQQHVAKGKGAEVMTFNRKDGRLEFTAVDLPYGGEVTICYSVVDAEGKLDYTFGDAILWNEQRYIVAGLAIGNTGHNNFLLVSQLANEKIDKIPLEEYTVSKFDI